MNALMSSRPRRGSCNEYLSSISDEAISSTTARLTFLPQNSVNQRPTTALFSSLLIGMAPRDLCCEDHRHPPMIQARITLDDAVPNSGSCLGIKSPDPDYAECATRWCKTRVEGMALPRSRANPGGC